MARFRVRERSGARLDYSKIKSRNDDRLTRDNFVCIMRENLFETYPDATPAEIEQKIKTILDRGFKPYKPTEKKEQISHVPADVVKRKK